MRKAAPALWTEAAWESDPHQCWTWWASGVWAGEKSCSRFNIWWKEWKLLKQHINVLTFYCHTAGTLGCPHTFGSVVSDMSCQTTWLKTCLLSLRGATPDKMKYCRTTMIYFTSVFFKATLIPHHFPSVQQHQRLRLAFLSTLQDLKKHRKQRESSSR